jgi:hypothetical protein
VLVASVPTSLSRHAKSETRVFHDGSRVRPHDVSRTPTRLLARAPTVLSVRVRASRRPGVRLPRADVRDCRRRRLVALTWRFFYRIFPIYGEQLTSHFPIRVDYRIILFFHIYSARFTLPPPPPPFRSHSTTILPPESTQHFFTRTCIP